jgi:Sodium:dicarboxylate symporter family
MSIGQQLGLLVFMIVASKGAAGVTGAGLATLAGGLQSHRPDLLDGVGLIVVEIDRFMSEDRAVTNFSGNAGATMLVFSWTKTIDRNKVNAVLGGSDPFDELTMCRSAGAGANPVCLHRAVPGTCRPHGHSVAGLLTTLKFRGPAGVIRPGLLLSRYAAKKVVHQGVNKLAG